jgi:hypothetical protein
MVTHCKYIRNHFGKYKVKSQNLAPCVASQQTSSDWYYHSEVVKNTSYHVGTVDLREV